MLRRLLNSLRSRHRGAPSTQAVAVPVTVRAEQALRERDYDRALTLIRRAVEDGEITARNYFSLGAYLLGAAEYEHAETAFREGTAASSGDLAQHLLMQAHAALCVAKRRAVRGETPSCVRPSHPAPKVSVIICSIDDHFFRRANESYTRALAAIPHEVIRIDDARSLCEGNNRGAAKSTGELLLFSHDDIEVFGEDFAWRLLDAMANVDVLGVAGTSELSRASWITRGHPYIFGQHAVPAEDHFSVQVWSAGHRQQHGIQALDGMFLCVRRAVWQQHPFDADHFRGWHMYDLDFTYSAYKAGCKLAVQCDLPVLHHRRPEAQGQAYSAAWEREGQLFLEKFPELIGKPQGITPDELVAVLADNALEWRLLLEELYT